MKKLLFFTPAIMLFTSQLSFAWYMGFGTADAAHKSIENAKTALVVTTYSVINNNGDYYGTHHLDHFSFDQVTDSQDAGVPFIITLNAKDNTGARIAISPCIVALSCPFGISPSTISFNGGSGYDVTILSSGTNAVITASFDGKTGTSNPICVNINRLRWKYDTKSPVYYSSPVIGPDGTIYVGNGGEGSPSRDTKGLFAINPDGTLKWKYTTQNNLFTPVLSPSGVIYVQDENSDLYAFNLDGTFRWNYAFNKQCAVGQTNPAIGADGTIYLGGGLHLCAINPDGTLKWTNPEGADTIHSSPAIAPDGTIYVGLRGDFGIVYTIDTCISKVLCWA